VRAVLPLLLGLAGTAHAQVVPTASAADAPICTDRPTKSNFACTVPAGAVQIEADAFSLLGTGGNGSRTTIIAVTNPTLKLGLTGHSDLQFNWSPHIRIRQRDTDGTVRTLSGPGDLTIRYKHRLTDATGAFQLALLPFVKLPTAPTGIGNGAVEAGLALPINYSLPGGWTITLGPQLDLLANAEGRHLGLTGLVNVARQIGAFTLYGELWTSHSLDPAGATSQYSLDLALAWLPRPTLQFDVGANIGLNPQTPDIVGYIGVSTRF
jgi:hypothetical protein